MATFLLDTNHLGVAATPGAAIRTTIRDRILQGDRFGTCVPALCELEAGIQQTRDPHAARQNLHVLMKQVRLWPLSPATSQLYGKLYSQLKKRGRALSQVDIMLAALAIQLEAILLTTDRDFEGVPEIQSENWLVQKS